MSDTLMDERFRENQRNAQLAALKASFVVIVIALFFVSFGRQFMRVEYLFHVVHILLAVSIALAVFLSEYLLYRYDHDEYNFDEHVNAAHMDDHDDECKYDNYSEKSGYDSCYEKSGYDSHYEKSGYDSHSEKNEYDNHSEKSSYDSYYGKREYDNRVDMKES